jgi:hypothetical protein
MLFVDMLSCMCLFVDVFICGYSFVFTFVATCGGREREREGRRRERDKARRMLKGEEAVAGSSARAWCSESMVEPRLLQDEQIVW